VRSVNCTTKTPTSGGNILHKPLDPRVWEGGYLKNLEPELLEEYRVNPSGHYHTGVVHVKETT